MALDIAMGGSTNTVLHLLAAAREADLDHTLDDIDAVSAGAVHLRGRAEWQGAEDPAHTATDSTPVNTRAPHP
jgi:hypothetical protein